MPMTVQMFHVRNTVGGIVGRVGCARHGFQYWTKLAGVMERHLCIKFFGCSNNIFIEIMAAVVIWRDGVLCMGRGRCVIGSLGVPPRPCQLSDKIISERHQAFISSLGLLLTRNLDPRLF